MNKLQKFENFLKDVQQQYADEFSDLNEITQRYRRLADTHELLKRRQEQSERDTDKISGELDAFNRQAGIESLAQTNSIANEK